MIDPAQIPPEAVEAAARAYEAPESGPTYAMRHRAAIAAALSAWPLAKEEWRDGFKFEPLPHGTAFRYSVLILPLTQEARDD